MCTLQKLFIITAFVCFLGIFTPKSILASDNIFGLHLTQTSDIGNASKIINSSGGDWGWVTIVIRTDQLDRNAWQEFFDNCRKFHLIPIIRLSTLMQNDSWKRPEYSDIDTLAGFLNSLNWPSIQQHIILFNEINHASEWGGAVDIKDYTDKAIYAAKKFKSLNPNFYILSSPLDLASPENPPQFKDAGNVYREIYLYNPDYFDQIDALASHSYPNHGFIGKPTDDGQHSIHGYQWELDDIRSLGVQKTYPVFITETGWPHREGETKANQFYTVTTAAQFLSYSLQNWGKDKRIQAVTPFIYNYPHAPFDHFSWLDLNENLYPEYQQIIQTPKLKNSIEQITKYEPVNIHIPYFLLPDTDYSGQIILKNTGQSVWGETQFCLNPQMTTNVILDAVCTPNNFIYPGQSYTFNFKFKILSGSDHEGRTFISWNGLPQYEITPISPKGIIYHPKTDFKDIFIGFVKNLFI